jgi:hypothetical protein
VVHSAGSRVHDKSIIELMIFRNFYKQFNRIMLAPLNLITKNRTGFLSCLCFLIAVSQYLLLLYFTKVSGNRGSDVFKNSLGQKHSWRPQPQRPGSSISREWRRGSLEGCVGGGKPGSDRHHICLHLISLNPSPSPTSRKGGWEM